MKNKLTIVVVAIAALVWYLTSSDVVTGGATGVQRLSTSRFNHLAKPA